MAEKGYEFEERAAILEFDGGLNRQYAENKAALEIKMRTLCNVCKKKADGKYGCNTCTLYDQLKKDCKKIK